MSYSTCWMHEEECCENWEDNLKRHVDYAYAVHGNGAGKGYHVHLVFNDYETLKDVFIDAPIMAMRSVYCRRALLDYLANDDSCIKFVDRTMAGVIDGAR